jgi:hypothetical protein
VVPTDMTKICPHSEPGYIDFRSGQKRLLQDARLSRTRLWLLGEYRKCFKFLGSLFFCSNVVEIYLDVVPYF